MTITTFSADKLQELTIKRRTNKLQGEIDRLCATGGGELVLTGGTYCVGSLRLGSHFTLRLAADAKLVFSTDITDYPVVASRWEGASQSVYRACLYGTELQDVQLLGEGVIDGQGVQWWQRFRSSTLAYPRPYLCSIENSVHVTIAGLTFKNSPAWTLHPLNCQNVLIDGVTVINPADSPNTDGLDPESCQNVRIMNCQFDVGDDCIAIKAGTEDALTDIPCRNITISNCSMLHGHGGVVLGSEMSGKIQNVVITTCTFVDTDRGIRFKTRRGRGGEISNISVSNIVMDQVLCPVVVNAYYFCGKKGSEKYVWTKETLPVDTRTPKIKNIDISHLTVTGIQSCVAFIYGLPEAPIENLSLSDSSFCLDSQSQPVAPAMIADAPEFAQAGIFIENTQQNTLRHLKISGATDAVIHDVHNPGLLTQLT
ncbi:glycoside hydrolase family 28 protein [Levilactobacillus brevis]|uniref:glycoside hydrolase family 28 protein n=1 Tax=Levilactobacillus brevis TaxID=1580 RepID=UPI0005834F6F|nr:glycoside hydrolase family 28 protein [Levilactobacillus brevis]KID43013.1 Polygalacturonase [Levilactobacillus brevis]MBS0977920.1 glycoside hydrolase family 28 protein [Levilactobacillus brevis]MCU0198717.1 glycoside hydrolase family 28 protein [Levilactobacillus brevis]ODP94220.1 endopolygalacturonase [Levilactobacillus brevis]ORJ55198.1 endopolygalacturonase [Levilactobacillus brevis]